MDKTMSMTRNPKHIDASSENAFKACDEGDGVPWSDLNHDVLYLVMMRLRVIDFVSFSGVCKSWRSLAVSNRNKFMASRPPMRMWISNDAYTKECYCYLSDFTGRRFKTLLPHSTGRCCVGLTCGYLILYSLKKYDFLLVNPITRHEIFPCRCPFRVSDPTSIRAVLVFSPILLSGWVFVMLKRNSKEIWFSTAGQEAWRYIYSTHPFLDLHVFKGKIYTLNTPSDLREARHVCEMSFNPDPKLVILETKTMTDKYLLQDFISSGENLFAVLLPPERRCIIQELDVGEMKWVLHEKTIAEYNFFHSYLKSSAAITPLSWYDPNWSRIFTDTPLNGSLWLPKEGIWYFPHDCFNVNPLDD